MVIMIYLMIRMTSRKNGKVNLRSHHEALEVDLEKKSIRTFNFEKKIE